MRLCHSTRRLGFRLAVPIAVVLCAGFASPTHAADSAITDLNIQLVEVTDWARISGASIATLCYAPDSSMLACGTSAGQVILFSMTDPGERRDLRNEGAAITGLDFSPDGHHLVAADEAGCVAVWDCTSEENLYTYVDDEPIREARFSPTGNYLVFAGDTALVHIRETSTWEALPSIAGHTGPIYAFAVSPEEDLLVTGAGDSDPSVRLWTFPDGEFLGSDLYEGRINDIEYSQRDRHAAISGSQLTVWLWEVDRLEFLHLIFGVGGSVPDIAYSSRGTAMVTVSTGGTLCYYRVPNVTPKRTIRFESPLAAVDFSPDRTSIACGDATGMIYLLTLP